MPDPFKNRFSIALIEQMANCFCDAYAAFDRDGFVQQASEQLEALELKQRSAQITRALHSYLPADFALSAKILLDCLSPMQTPNRVSELPEHAHLLKGWAIMPMADYAASHGQTHFTLSMQLMYEMTQRFSAEFAIRYLIVNKPAQTLAMLSQWLNDSSEHVRRLISEGTRPRLPWGIQLGEFVRDPAPILPLLEALKDDPSEYVRRSVANNLNDIAKDHPDVVIAISKRWLASAKKQRQKLIRHACRSLFKQGHAEALAMFGFAPASLSKVSLKLSKSQIAMGDNITMQLTLTTSSDKAQRIMLDYQVYHQKANGKLIAKVFKWKVFELAANETLTLFKRHSVKAVTTRKYYPGEHLISVLINGKEYAQSGFELT